MMIVVKNFCKFSGRSDFDNIDNEALDFEQLEAFIQNNTVVNSPNTTAQTVVENAAQINPSTNLPESPPDSGSEPPYSPNIKNIQIDQMQQSQGALSMSTLTELHVPHHQHLNHHNHNLHTEIYLANEHHHQQQQLLQINNLLHKHESSAAQPSASQQIEQDHQMLLYQVNQNGQIMELNHIHNQPMTNRLYKNDMMELEPAMHEMQQTLQSTLNDNLPIIIGGDNYQQIPSHTITAPPQQSQQNQQQHHVKKRKSQNYLHSNASENLKTFAKSETSK
jgi:hypothetical protein